MCDEKKAEKTPGPMGAGTVEMRASRQSARGVLNDKIKCAEERLVSLGILSKVIPWDLLQKEDEESLWRYFTRRNH